MSSITDHDEHQEVINTNKGKARAAPEESTERTPLLPSSSRLEDGEDVYESRNLRTKLAIVFTFTLGLCLIVLGILLVVAFSFTSRAEHLSPDEVIERGLVLKGPDRVDVLNVSRSDGIWINVESRMGLNAGSILGVNFEGEDEGLGRYLRKCLGQWGIKQLGHVTIQLGALEIYALHTDPSTPRVQLATFKFPVIDVPLTLNPPPNTSWLTRYSMPVFIAPTNDTSALIHFVRDSWRNGAAAVRVDVPEVHVRGGSLSEPEGSWRRKIEATRRNVRTSFGMKIPEIPGLPTPGKHDNFPSLSQLITLKEFEISSDLDTLSLQATATAINPAPKSFSLSAPSLPFTIFFPSHKENSPPYPVTSVHTQPLSLTYPNVSLSISGTVLPLNETAAPLLSTFLSRYLSAQENPISISSPLLPDLILDTVFPAPEHKPNILQNVTIRDMWIKPGKMGGPILASGTVFAKLVLPKGMNVGLEVSEIFPDVLVFDGEIPEPAPSPLTDVGKGGKSRKPPPPPDMPEPLPENAFGHIRPEEWLDSLSVPDGTVPDGGSVFAISAKFSDVALQVLPGRHSEFNSFVRKVIFGSAGAIAGIQGFTSVAVRVHGLPYESDGGVLELNGLPFQGSVRIGKKSLFGDD